MRPLQLKIKGLNSFMEEQVIDFEKLTTMGLFGIFGQTGSGKSSILDGITLSLYGKIARGNGEFLNKNMDVLKVSFQFSLSGESHSIYRVEREMKRNSAGDVRTSYAKILQIEGESEIILEDKVGAVNKKCEEIIGLNAEDFSRTVVLPQGKFSEFLKLQNAPRREMLERIFNLESYGALLSSKVAKRISLVRTKQSELSGQLMGYEHLSSETVLESKQALEKSQSELAKKNSDMKVLQLEFETARGIWQLIEKIQKLESAFNQQKEGEQTYKAHVERITLAEEAEKLKPYWEAVLNLEKILESEKVKQNGLNQNWKNSQETLKIAKSQYEEVHIQREFKLPGLKLKENQLSEAILEIKNLLADEGALAEVLLELEKMEEVLIRDRKNLEKRQSDYAQKQGQVERLEKQIEELQQPETYKNQLREAYQLKRQVMEQGALLKAKVDGLNLEKQQVIASKEKLAKLKENQEQSKKAAKELSLSIFALEREALVALQKHISQVEEDVARLEKAHGTLEKNQLAEQLRVLLVDGEACPVCGSTDHQQIPPIDHVQEKGALETLKSEKETLTGELQSLQKMLTLLELKHKKSEEDLKHYSAKETIEKQAGEESSFLKVESLKEFKGAYKAFVDKVKPWEEALVSRGLEISENEKNIAVLQSEVTMKIAQYEKLKEEAKEGKEKFDALKDSFMKSLGEVDPNELEGLVKKIAENDKAIDQYSASLKVMKASFKTDQAVIEQCLENVQKLEVKLTADRSTYTARQEACLKLRNLLTQKVGDIEGVLPALTQVQGEILALEEGYEALKKSYEELEKESQNLQSTLLEVGATIKLQENQLKEHRLSLETQLKNSPFENVESAMSQCLTPEEKNRLKEFISQYQSRLDQLKGALESARGELGERTLSIDQWQSIQENYQREMEELEILKAEVTRLTLELTRLETQMIELSGLLFKKAEVDQLMGQLSDLAKLFEARKFVAFIASSQLQYISGKASEQLMDITQGTYALEADRDGNFLIRDYKNGGVTREASTLSGGETFLVSLALALALSAQIQLKGKAPLELFFLDEGFGTLDDETLEVVMGALENLHHEKLSIGLISHVESIKNRVPIKLLVSPAKSGLGGSKVKIELS